MKMGKSKWIHDPSRRNIHSLNNLRFDASRHFINRIKNGYQRRTSRVTDDVCDLIADSYNLLVWWGISYSRLCNEPGVSQIRERDIQTPLPQGRERNVSEFELVIGKLKYHKSTSIP